LTVADVLLVEKAANRELFVRLTTDTEYSPDVPKDDHDIVTVPGPVFRISKVGSSTAASKGEYPSWQTTAGRLASFGRAADSDITVRQTSIRTA